MFEHLRLVINRFGISLLFYGAHVELVFHVRFHLTAVTPRERVIHGLVLDTVQNQRSESVQFTAKERKKQRKIKTRHLGRGSNHAMVLSHRPHASTTEPLSRMTGAQSSRSIIILFRSNCSCLMTVEREAYVGFTPPSNHNARVTHIFFSKIVPARYLNTREPNL